MLEKFSSIKIIFHKIGLNRIIIPLIICLILLTGCGKKEFEVIFIGHNNDIIEKIVVSENEEITYPDAPKVEGYHFIGWDNDIKETDKNIIIKAQYEVIYHSVYFYDTDDKLINYQKVEHGKNAIEPEIPEMYGYKFIGWSKDIENVTSDLDVVPLYEEQFFTVKFYNHNDEIIKEEVVKYGERVSNPQAPKVEGYKFVGWNHNTYSVTSDLDVRPIYEIAEYMIKFYDGKGNVISEQKLKYGEKAVIPDGPKLDGYEFLYWDKKCVFANTDMNIYPVFKKAIYTVEFYDDTDEIISIQYVEYGDSAISPINPEKEGYAFEKWDTDYTKVTGNLKVKPIFKINKYMVTFCEPYGSDYDTIEIEYGKTIYQPNEPYKYNYIFVGWYEDLTFNRKYNFSKEVTKDLKLYAKFEIDAVKITNAITTNYIKGIVKIYNKSYDTFLGIPTTSSVSQGSGFCFHIQDGCYYILTNCHVAVKDPSYSNQEFTIEDYKGNTYKGYLYKNPNKTMSAIAAAYDLACLYFKSSSTEVKKLTLADVNPKEYDDIISIGAPKGQTNSIAYGKVQGYGQITLNNTPTYKSNVQFNVICHDGYSNSGSSGGPILNANLEVVGVNYAGTNPVYYGYAIPIEKVKEFLKIYAYN